MSWCSASYRSHQSVLGRQEWKGQEKCTESLREMLSQNDLWIQYASQGKSEYTKMRFFQKQNCHNIPIYAAWFHWIYGCFGPLEQCQAQKIN